MSGGKYIIAIGLGTTGNRVYCFDCYGKTISSSYSEFTQYFPNPGWVEHDAVEIWNSLICLIPESIGKGKLDPADAITIGITNQRETSLIWDTDSGKPLHKAIVWQCRRTAGMCSDLKEKGYENLFRSKSWNRICN